MSARLTAEQRAAYRATCDAATPEPWRVGAPQFICGLPLNADHVRHSRAGGCRYVLAGWSTDSDYGMHEVAPDLPLGVAQFPSVCGNYETEQGGVVAPSDAAFIARARTGWPAALDALDAAEAEIARLTAKLDECAADLTALEQCIDEALPEYDQEGEGEATASYPERVEYAGAELDKRDKAEAEIARLRAEVARLRAVLARVPHLAGRRIGMSGTHDVGDHGMDSAGNPVGASESATARAECARLGGACALEEEKR